MVYKALVSDRHNLLQNGNSSINVQIHSIALEYKQSPAQVLLSWAVQRGTSVVPRTTREQRLDENRQLINLDHTTMDVISQLVEERGHVRFLDPRDHIGFDIFDESHDQPIPREDQRNQSEL